MNLTKGFLFVSVGDCGFEGFSCSIESISYLKIKTPKTKYGNKNKREAFCHDTYL
jgi:hypothetical protein